jgi:putative Ca2+/H+ antiporter (TMEM165/GDT1 family)
MRIASSVLFVAIGLVMGWRSWRAGSGSVEGGASCDTACLLEGETGGRARDWRAFGSTLSLLFLAELGDKTQLAVLGLAGREASAVGVFAGGALALVAVTALGVIGGEQLCRLIPERILVRLSAAAFVVMGTLMALGML